MNDREAQQEDVGILIGSSAKLFVILLTSSVPKNDVDQLVIDLFDDREVVKHRWRVLIQEGVKRVRHQQGGFTLTDQSSISDRVKQERTQSLITATAIHCRSTDSLAPLGTPKHTHCSITNNAEFDCLCDLASLSLDSASRYDFTCGRGGRGSRGSRGGRGGRGGG
jgi:hypothetical protein